MDILPPRANSFTLPESSPAELMMLACRALILFMIAATPSGNIGCDAAQPSRQSKHEVRTLNMIKCGMMPNLHRASGAAPLRNTTLRSAQRRAAAQRHARNNLHAKGRARAAAHATSRQQSCPNLYLKHATKQ